MSYSVKTNKITTYSNYADRKFAVLTDEQMKLTYADYIWNRSFNVNNLQSANEVLGNYQVAVKFLSLSIFNLLEIFIFILLKCLIIIK